MSRLEEVLLGEVELVLDVLKLRDLRLLYLGELAERFLKISELHRLLLLRL